MTDLEKSKSMFEFDEYQVRREWDKENEKWWLCIVDVVAVLTEQLDYQVARSYWKKLKQRLREEGNETVTNCHRLKIPTTDGKMRLMDVADTEQILRLIQSIPNKKAEHFKLWLARVGSERIDETINPELAIERMIQTYRKQGYDEVWIAQRMKSIEVRKELTGEWQKGGVKDREYAILTDEMSKTWSGKTVKQYRDYKGLKKENLRDNMTNTELILTMLAESVATDLSKVEEPYGFRDNMEVAKKGATVAKNTRKEIEETTGKPVVSRLNANDMKQGKLENQDE